MSYRIPTLVPTNAGRASLNPSGCIPPHLQRYLRSGPPSTHCRDRDHRKWPAPQTCPRLAYRGCTRFRRRCCWFRWMVSGKASFRIRRHRAIGCPSNLRIESPATLSMPATGNQFPALHWMSSFRGPGGCCKSRFRRQPSQSSQLRKSTDRPTVMGLSALHMM